jgi:hypothetical protein
MEARFCWFVIRGKSLSPLIPMLPLKGNIGVVVEW